jgi:hypothetical protein
VIVGETGRVMCSTVPPAPVHVYPREGGVDVVPHVLPLWVSEEAYGLTVGEWLGVEEGGR